MNRYRPTWLKGLIAFGMISCACGKNYEASQPAVEPAPASGPAQKRDEASGKEQQAPAKLEQSDAVEAEAMEEDQGEPPGEVASESVAATQLAVEWESFEQQMKPSELSCDGAKPYLDSICALAKRICESGNVLKPDHDCEAAQLSCEKAKSRYRASCSK